MARTPTGPRYFASRHAYYSQLNGKQYCLAQGPEGDPETVAKAGEAYRNLMVLGTEHEDKDHNAIANVLNAYCLYSKRHRKESTYTSIKWHCQQFVNHCKLMRVCDLTIPYVEAWLVSRETPHNNGKHKKLSKWGDGTRYIAIKVLKAAFNWGIDNDLCHTNPIKRMKMPHVRSRGKESMITDAQHEQFMSIAKGNQQLILIGLLDSGARPGEIRKVTASELKQIQGKWVYDLSDWKTRGKHLARLILLSPRLAEISRMLAEKYPHGPIFRNNKGIPWTDKALQKLFARLRHKAALPDTITPYSYRHAFATKCLLDGIPIAIVAQLMGNSVDMIHRHYAHLTTDISRLFDYKFKEVQVQKAAAS